MFVKFLQISQENTCVGVSLTKLQAFGSGTLLKRDSNTGVFLWNLQNFYERLFWRTFANDYFWASFAWSQGFMKKCMHSYSYYILILCDTSSRIHWRPPSTEFKNIYFAKFTKHVFCRTPLKLLLFYSISFSNFLTSS